MGEAEGTVLEGDDVVAVLDSANHALRGHYGCVVHLNAEGKVVARGTMTFVGVDGRAILVTANHVAEPLLLDASEWELLLPPASMKPDGQRAQPLLPRRFRLADVSLIWSSTEMDVAVLAPSPEIRNAPELHWLDGRRGVQQTRDLLRPLWKSLAEQETPLPLILLGFPTFGHLVETESLTEILTSVPLIAYISALDNQPPAGWGAKLRAPQMHIELDAHEPEQIRKDLDGLAAARHRSRRRPCVRGATRYRDTDRRGARRDGAIRRTARPDVQCSVMQP